MLTPAALRLAPAPDPRTVYKLEKAEAEKRRQRQTAAIFAEARAALESAMACGAPKNRAGRKRAAGIEVQGAAALRHPVAKVMPTPRARPTTRATLTCKTCPAVLTPKPRGRAPDYCDDCRREQTNAQNRRAWKRRRLTHQAEHGTLAEQLAARAELATMEREHQLAIEARHGLAGRRAAA